MLAEYPRIWTRHVAGWKKSFFFYYICLQEEEEEEEEEEEKEEKQAGYRYGHGHRDL